MGVEPALVNPDLPVAAPHGRAAGTGTGPEPAYHLLSPQARWAYLDWMATGRHADVPSGLIMLFCFGLERRVLVDADLDPAVRTEMPAITAEVRRLRGRYGDGGSTLRKSLDDLLALLELLAARGGAPKADEPGGTGTMGVRITLARFAAASAPVPADWARAWVRHHPSLDARSAEGQCPVEFDRLFTLRYHDRHGAGLVPPDDVPGIRLRYQPANPGLTTTLVCREDLPDVLAEPRGTRVLGSLVDSVTAALDPYRRWLARFPEGRGSLAAAALLPRELVDAGHGQLGALRVWAERQLDGRPWAVVDAGGFWAFWSTAAPDRMERDEAAAFIAVLATVGFGVEPDVRFGAPSLTRGPAVLFRLGRPTSDRPGARFPAAAVIARCAAAVASAAQPRSLSERRPASARQPRSLSERRPASARQPRSLSERRPASAQPIDPQGTAETLFATVGDLAAALRLDPGEDLRLAARLAWLLTTRIDIERLGRQIARLTAAERETAGHHLVAVALAADPAVGPAAVAALIRVYRILLLEPDLVFHRLHERSVGGAPNGKPGPRSSAVWPGQAALSHLPPVARPEALTGRVGGSAAEQDEPVVVRAADAVSSGYALPWAPTAALSAGVELDRAMITRKIAESTAAAELLDAIFDTGDAGNEGDQASASGPAPVAGLDLAHSALLRALATRPSWSREEFASLAAAQGVLPDGALDVLNDVAIDATGAPVVEEGDTLAVDNDVLLELLE